MKKYFILHGLLFITFAATSQPQTHSYRVPKKLTIELKPENDKWNPVLQNHELPKPHSGIDAKIKEQIKDSLTKLYRINRNSVQRNKTASAINPPGMFRNFLGNAYNYFIPNDNDMAISDSEVVCSVTNTTIWSRNLVTNQTFGSFNLHTITLGLGLAQEEFDPKIMYDPGADRFIFVCLNGFTDSTSNVIVGFSQDNTTYGSWNFYSFPGNPLNNSLWTDFPMMAISQNEVFITGNLLYNDSTWQAGFNESIIWQFNKWDGYNGNLINAQLHSSIFYNGSPIRNLCPVKGGSQLYGPSMTFLSNRNFSASNDSIFIVNISDTAFASGQSITVDHVTASVGYHMPVGADQPYIDNLDVNDARILGAFIEGQKIQFVASTLDTITGNDGIYHGVIYSSGPLMVCTTYIYTDSLDLAYPNISLASAAAGTDSAIIGFVQSSANVFPGSGAILYDGISQYSPVTTIKSGAGYINVLAFTNHERWGDYTGNQRKYNQPGIVWMSGSFALTSHNTRTWIAELSATSTTGINNFNAASLPEEKLYPNPADKLIAVDFDNPSPAILVFSVYDVKGALVKSLYRGNVIKGKNKFTFSTEALLPGIYILRISSSAGFISEKKFTRQ